MDWIDQTRTRAIIGLLWLLTWIDKTWLNKTRIDIVSLSCQPAITFYLRFLETAEAWLPAAVRKCSRRIEGRTRSRDGGNQRCRRLLFHLLRAASPWNYQYSRIVIKKTETKQNKRSHPSRIPSVDKWYPFHVHQEPMRTPSLELCIPSTAVNTRSF